MLLAPHILAGAAIAAQFSNPFVGMLFAFLSHFVLDSIPHWEYSIEPLKNIKIKGIRYVMPILYRIVIDIFIGFSVVVVAMSLSDKNVSLDIFLFGGFFGILPDGLSFLLFLGRGNKFTRTFLLAFYAVHRKIHYDKEHNGMPPIRIGLTTQAIISLLALYFIVF